MTGFHPFLFYDYARVRQDEILAEAEQVALAKSARPDSHVAWPRPTVLLSVVLILVMVSGFVVLV